MSYPKNIHFTSPLYFQFKSFLSVGKAFLIANKVTKTYFEMEKENHTKSHHPLGCVIYITYLILKQSIKGYHDHQSEPNTRYSESQQAY
jgi:hypothetical protein